MIRDLFAALSAFVLMEPATYAAHRWVMHGVGWVLHQSHHRRRRLPAMPRWRQQVELNDAYPVIFAAATILAMAAGSNWHSLSVLVPVGIGVTVYGALYAFVHDVYIHGRFLHLPMFSPFERLRRAHAVHHLYGGEPYGMLCPIVPKVLRERSRNSRLDPLARPEKQPVTAG